MPEKLIECALMALPKNWFSENTKTENDSFINIVLPNNKEIAKNVVTKREVFSFIPVIIVEETTNNEKQLQVYSDSSKSILSKILDIDVLHDINFSNVVTTIEKGIGATNKSHTLIGNYFSKSKFINEIANKTNAIKIIDEIKEKIVNVCELNVLNTSGKIILEEYKTKFSENQKNIEVLSDDLRDELISVGILQKVIELKELKKTIEKEYETEYFPIAEDIKWIDSFVCSNVKNGYNLKTIASKIFTPKDETSYQILIDDIFSLRKIISQTETPEELKNRVNTLQKALIENKEITTVPFKFSYEPVQV